MKTEELAPRQLSRQARLVLEGSCRRPLCTGEDVKPSLQPCRIVIHMVTLHSAQHAIFAAWTPLTERQCAPGELYPVPGRQQQL